MCETAVDSLQVARPGLSRPARVARSARPVQVCEARDSATGRGFEHVERR